MLKNILESRDPGELYESLSYILSESAQRLDEQEGLAFLKKVWVDYRQVRHPETGGSKRLAARLMVYVDLDRKIVLVEPLLRFLRGAFSACLSRLIVDRDPSPDPKISAEIVTLHTILYLIQTSDVHQSVDRLFAYESFTLMSLSRLVNQVCRSDIVDQDMFVFQSSLQDEDHVEVKTMAATAAAIKASIEYGESRFSELSEQDEA